VYVWWSLCRRSLSGTSKTSPRVDQTLNSDAGKRNTYTQLYSSLVLETQNPQAKYVALLVMLSITCGSISTVSNVLMHVMLLVCSSCSCTCSVAGNGMTRSALSRSSLVGAGNTFRGLDFSIPICVLINSVIFAQLIAESPI